MTVTAIRENTYSFEDDETETMVLDRGLGRSRMSLTQVQNPVISLRWRSLVSVSRFFEKGVMRPFTARAKFEVMNVLFLLHVNVGDNNSRPVHTIILQMIQTA